MFSILQGVCPECGKDINWASCEPMNCKFCGYVEPDESAEPIEHETIIHRGDGTSIKLD